MEIFAQAGVWDVTGVHGLALYYRHNVHSDSLCIDFDTGPTASNENLLTCMSETENCLLAWSATL